MNKARALTITVEGKSDEHLQKLLKLALFDLSKMREEAWCRPAGASIPLEMAGDMGGYSLRYTRGSQELGAAHESLIGQGYRWVETTEWKVEDYSVYEHEEKPAVRLYLESARTEEHDPADHNRF
jgi:hypothetical protein